MLFTSLARRVLRVPDVMWEWLSSVLLVHIFRLAVTKILSWPETLRGHVSGFQKFVDFRRIS